MEENVHEWRWTDVHRSHLVREMKWKCVHCPAVLPIAKAENRINATEGLSAEALARKFHEYYEELAPSFDYETREETRNFAPHSRNGKLMIAVSEKIMADILEGK